MWSTPTIRAPKVKPLFSSSRPPRRLLRITDVRRVTLASGPASMFDVEDNRPCPAPLAQVDATAECGIFSMDLWRWLQARLPPWVLARGACGGGSVGSDEGPNPAI